MKRSAATSPAEQSFAEELDRRVAERTAELTATIEQLKKEPVELNRTERALSARQLDFQLIVDSIPAQVAVITPTGEVETLNQPCLEYFGKTLDELKGWVSSDPVHPDDLPHVIEVLTHALETDQTYEVESRHRRFDGIYRWFHVCGFPLKDTEGRILRWCVLLTDIDVPCAFES
jgi:PAS domain S-box-containing protein